MVQNIPFRPITSPIKTKDVISCYSILDMRIMNNDAYYILNRCTENLIQEAEHENKKNN